MKTQKRKEQLIHAMHELRQRNREILHWERELRDNPGGIGNWEAVMIEDLCATHDENLSRLEIMKKELSET